jgi:Zn-dependent peptidase ImmA (M78 family)/transcriptional regulator with XRE-family HTH domain
MNEEQTIAANVARLRANADLSQGDLAQAAGLTRLTLGKIERGEVLPRAETISEIARALKVSVRELVTPVRSLTKVRFRAPKRINSREQLLAQVAGWLEGYTSLEQELGDTRDFPLAALATNGASHGPENLAKLAREQLELSEDEPIRDVCGLLEKNGVKVHLTVRNTDSFFGLSVAPTDGGPAVVVNKWERISVERWIFTAAHELGHLLLHASSYDRSLDEEDPKQEREADRFASYFLMPEAVFGREWEDTSGLAFLDRVLKVKRIFRVSYKTVLYRLIESKRASGEAWKIFQVQHKRRFGKSLSKIDEPQRLLAGEFRLDWTRAGEPDGLSENDFVEDRLSRLVRRAVEGEVISLGRAAEILGISRIEMRERAAAWGD